MKPRLSPKHKVREKRKAFACNKPMGMKEKELIKVIIHWCFPSKACAGQAD